MILPRIKEFYGIIANYLHAINDQLKSEQMIFKSTYFMEQALLGAKKALSNGEVPVGAVIVNSTGEIIASSYNQNRALFDPTAHAEILAIRKACKKTGNMRLTDHDIYVTLEPCPMCAQALSLARIRRVYFALSDPKGGGIDNGARVLSANSCHHKPEVYSGIMEQDVKIMMQEFFKSLRD